MLRIPFILLFAMTTLFTSACGPAAPKWKGSYSGSVNGEALTLNITEETGNALKGDLYDGYQTFTFAATATGDNFTGTAASATAKISIPVKGSLKGNTITLDMTVGSNQISATLEKQAAATTTTTTATSDQKDPKVVGTWEYQENRSDPMGSSTYSERMVFFADGSFGSGGSSAGFSGGGGSASSGSSKVEKIPGITWFTRDKAIYLTAVQNGQTQTEKLGKYFIENGAMLITADNGKKVLFYKK